MNNSIAAVRTEPRRGRRVNVLVLACVLCVTGGSVRAAEPPERDVPAIDWQEGPLTGDLGNIAQVAVPAGYRFTGADGARKFMEYLENPTSGAELGVIIPNEGENFWFVIFEFDPMGYVKDDEKSSLDADAILASLREGNERGNEERKKRGWAAFEILGWEAPPFYNEKTHNLEWAIRGQSEGHKVVNYSTRILGRKGVMNADLVLSPEHLEATAPSYKTLLAAMSFKPGQRYAEFREGDKLATYGLTALVAGGAGAIAAKTGLLAKFWKLLVAAAVAVTASLRKVLGKLFRRDTGSSQASDAPPQA